tara:strand:+ start:909 stop:3149 length:2241 start_codon:yes stop_codon:yes gene_type:complete
VTENKWSIFEAIDKSNKLRASGDEYGYYYNKDGMMDIGDPLVFNKPDYSQLNEAIVKQGEEDTKNLTELMGKASEIKAHPQGYLPFNIPFPTNKQANSFITSTLTNLGIPIENSMFVADLLTDANDTGFGLGHFVGFGELADVAEGFPMFQAGLQNKDPMTAVMGVGQTTLGLLGGGPFVKEFVKKVTPKAKEALSWMAGKAREYKVNQAPGTKLLSTDPTDPAVDAIIKLDELVNKPQGPELTGSSGELGFYSKALEETKKLQQKKGTGQQFRQMLKKAGVSDDEIEWSGLETALRKDKTTKKEIEDQLRLNNLEIKEVVKDKMPEEATMNWDSAYSRSNDDINYVKPGNELKEGELPTSPSAKINAENLMTPEEVFGPNYIDNRADELLDENSKTGVTVNSNYTIEQARADALAEFYDDPFIRIEDENTGMVILGNDSTGYSIFPDMQSTKGEGAHKNALKTLYDIGEKKPIYSLSEAKVQAQQIAEEEGLIGGFGDEGMVMFSDDSYRLAGGENYREFVITSNKSQEGVPYSGDHFEEENIIGHFRTSDRTTLAGDKVLYIDEIQSDWGQKGREKGFKKDIDDPNDSGQIVRGPFVENTPKWTDLMVKRILAKAVDEGYDMVAFSPGYIQNMRWKEKGLLKYYDDILVKRVTKIVNKLDDTSYERIDLDDMDLDDIKERALNDTKKHSGEGKHYDFTKDQVLQPFTVRITNKLKEGVKKGQSLFALPVVAGTTAMTMEGDDVR